MDFDAVLMSANDGHQEPYVWMPNQFGSSQGIYTYVFDESYTEEFA